MSDIQAQALRNVSGGVVGHMTPVEITVDLAKNPELGTIGDHALGVTIPAGKFILGGYIKNLADDLSDGASNTATLQVKVGTTGVTTATAISTLKGDGLCAIDDAPALNEAAAALTLTVATADITAGKVTVGVIYM